ncbi:MAG: hypothetical protein ABR589_05085 [Chthoniobacterales bacterium]
MKRIAATASLLLVVFGSTNAAEPAGTPEQQLAALVKEIQAQQALIVENQAKIDAKLVTVAEAVRVAKIYSSRAGH